MATPTRFSKVGLSGRRSSENKGDYYLQNVVVPIEAVASAAVQSTGVILPARCRVQETILNVLVAETSAASKLVNIGFVSDPDALGLNRNVSTVGFRDGNEDVNGSGEEVAFQLAGADFVEFKGEIVIMILASDES